MSKVFIKNFIDFTIRLYQKISPFFYVPFVSSGYGCRYYPSCSEYARQAVEKHGTVKGLILGAKRVIRCHPWSKGGYDPVEPHNA